MALVLLLGTLLLVAAAGGAGSGLKFDLPSGCAPQAFYDPIAGRNIPTTWIVLVRVSEGHDAATVHASLEVETGDSVVRRDLVAEDCSAALRGLGFALLLALPEEEALVHGAGPDGVANVSLSEKGHSHDRSANSATASPAASHVVRVRVLADVRSDFSEPFLAGGGALEVTFGRHWIGELGAEAAFNQNVSIPGAEATFSLVHGHLGACFEGWAYAEKFETFACASIEPGAISVSGTAVTEGESHTRFWFSTNAGLRVRSSWNWAFAQIDGGLRVPIARDRFYVDPGQTVMAVAPVSGFGGFSLGVHFK